MLMSFFSAILSWHLKWTNSALNVLYDSLSPLPFTLHSTVFNPPPQQSHWASDTHTCLTKRTMRAGAFRRQPERKSVGKTNRRKEHANNGRESASKRTENIQTMGKKRSTAGHIQELVRHNLEIIYSREFRYLKFCSL